MLSQPIGKRGVVRWLAVAALMIGVLLSIAAVVIGVHLMRAAPQVDGELRLPGAPASVRIERDAHAIPTIHADTAEAGLWALGFVHAQDRLWQLEMNRRVASGRLAEVFGADAVGTDRFLRALGVRRAAQAQWQSASDSTRRALEAYSAGINAWITHGMRARPPEFVALGVEPEPWTPVDSLGWAIMMAWDLGGNWSTELLRMRLSKVLPVERIHQLLPPYPGDKPAIEFDYAPLFRDVQGKPQVIRQALGIEARSEIEGQGSNNWVVAGSRSATGSPLLANDPHLKLSAPALWYLARIKAGDLQVAGGTLPGLPFVVLGQNRDIAWGFTNTNPDVQDVYMERLRPGDAGQYQTPEGWAPFRVHREVIKVKGANDVVMQARETRHGPVISDAGGASTAGLTGPAVEPVHALALRWTALDPDSAPIDTGLAFNRARSVDELIEASAGYVAPMQNIVVADRAGRIALVAAGRVPVRHPDNLLRGQVPSPGWDALYDWIGYIDAGATPREIDPPRGFIATANQRIHGADYTQYVGSEWAPPYRHQRIDSLLEARPLHDLASLRAIQADEVSLAVRRLLAVLQRARSTHPLAADAQRLLAGFDATMAADRAAPLIVWSWTRHLTRRVFADDMGPLFERSFSGRSFRSGLEGVLERDDDWWCDDQRTPEGETCSDQIDAAFTAALDELRQAHGGDVSRWRWGDAHVARAEHSPFSRVSLLARMFELRTPVGGDTYTVNVSRVGLTPDARTGELYLDEHGPSMRALYDIADPERSRIVLSSGQSGLFFSPHYRDMLEPWRRVEDLPLWSAPPVATLRLVAP